MSQENKKKEQSQREGGRPSRRVLSAEKKYQIFLEAQREEKAAAEILRREGLYSTDLARIRKQVKEGALERLSARPGRKAATVPAEQYETLKRELEERERVLAEMSVELAMLRKKRMGVRGSDRGGVDQRGAEARDVGPDGTGSRPGGFHPESLSGVADQSRPGTAVEEAESEGVESGEREARASACPSCLVAGGEGAGVTACAR